MTAMVFIAFTLGVAWYGRSAWNPSISELRNRCQEAMRTGDWTAAQKHATHWTSIAPDSGEPWMQLAETLRRQRKYGSVLDCLNHVPHTSPEAESALIARMELQFGPMNRPADAAETCEAILAIDPKSQIAQQRLIFFLTFTLQRTRLVRQIRLAVDAGNEPMESYVYLFLSDSLLFSNGAESNGRWLLGEPDSELFEVAEAIFIAENLDLSAALDDLAGAQQTRRAFARKTAVMKKLLAKYPHNAELLAYNARQHMQTGDVAGVVNLLAQVTVDSEIDHRFWRLKGWVHAQRNQQTDAEKSYRRALELHPLDWTTRHMLAELLQQQERFEEVKTLRDLVTRANELRRTLQHAPNARQISPDILSRLADYAADCHDTQVSDALRRRIRQINRS